MSHVKHAVNELINKYNTRCPFELADHLGIEIFEYAFKKVRGMVFNFDDRKIIGVKFDMPHHEKRAIIAHEIGHEQLHPAGTGYFFIKEHTSFVPGKFEREADLFAAMLLLDEGAEPGETIQGYSTRLKVPEYLVKIIYPE